MNSVRRLINSVSSPVTVDLRRGYEGSNDYYITIFPDNISRYPPLFNEIVCILYNFRYQKANENPCFFSQGMKYEQIGLIGEVTF